MLYCTYEQYQTAGSGTLDEAAFLAFWRHFGVMPKTNGAF